MHGTPWNQYDRTFGVYTPHGHCGSQINAILVASNTSDTKTRADSPLYLSIP
jgi:hypothetical protein